MVAQRLIVILSLISKESSIILNPRAVANEQVPIVMTYLMSEMSEQSAIGLMHRHTPFFAFHVVALVDVHGDDAVIVSRKYARSPRKISLEFEGQSAFGVFELGSKWKCSSDRL